MQPSFISTPDKLHGLHNVFLQLGSVYFSTGAECISPLEQSVFLHRKGVLPKLHNSKFGRYPKVWLIQSKLTEMQQITTKSAASSEIRL